MEIQCPTNNMYVRVAGSGSGSSSSGTICVRGDTGDGDDGVGLPLLVRVRVLSGHVPPTGPAEPKLPYDVDVVPVGTQWCATNVPVSASSYAGVPFTVLAWLRTGTTWSAPASAWFYAGGQNPTSCCPTSPSEQAAPGAIAGAFQGWPPPPPPLPANVTGQQS
ncbi:hypothetical protein J8F10_02575 [Gemmata sp. G18]|uniref:Uncharacterized protein n=1 Tax=Gemmata palustris TaxID=2822762 RepID=A0ABS5BKE6_9BACT|nr:hypothetical protein [Gemmata palustris]MBP3954181.1 hypothetical protein [Gemmata palustris]